MAFMELDVTSKGATYSCECAKCGSTLYTHEWADFDHNDRRDAMAEGKLRCDHCNGRADPATFHYCGRQYAARYSAPGYLDCTDWSYDSNKRRLEREVRSMYG